jgi:transposase
MGRTKGGLTSKLHAVCDGDAKSLILLMTEGQVSDYQGAALVLEALPTAHELIADRGYDSDWLRKALINKGITPCIPHQKVCEAANRLRIGKNRKIQYEYNKTIYKKRHKIDPKSRVAKICLQN